MCKIVGLNPLQLLLIILLGIVLIVGKLVAVGNF